MVQYANSQNIKLLISTPYYSQANGQVESINKIFISLTKKHIGQKPKSLHESFDQVLWAYRNSPKGVTSVTPFKLVYGQEVVLSIEINLKSIRIQRQSEVPVQDYWDTTYDELNILDKECLIILTNIIRQKERIAIHYNKKLRKKIFLNWRFGLQSSIVNG